MGGGGDTELEKRIRAALRQGGVEQREIDALTLKEAGRKLLDVQHDKRRKAEVDAVLPLAIAEGLITEMQAEAMSVDELWEMFCDTVHGPAIMLARYEHPSGGGLSMAVVVEAKLRASGRLPAHDGGERPQRIQAAPESGADATAVKKLVPVLKEVVAALAELSSKVEAIERSPSGEGSTSTTQPQGGATSDDVGRRVQRLAKAVDALALSAEDA